MVENIVSEINALLWGWPMMILLVGTHLFLTFRLKFPQRWMFTAIKLSLKKDKEAEGDVSQFGALATALAATIGTGNIIGVATAITLGGPGAIFWCWIMGFFGIATKYSEALLAIKYRVTTAKGKMLGGPMYALEKGLGCKWAGVMFAIFTVTASFGIGCSVQSNAISSVLDASYGVSPLMTGICISVLASAVILGGVRSIAKVCTAIVPFMALLYFAGCLVILAINHAYLWDALCIIVKSAFTPEATGGGFAGSTIMLTARYGIARGLFSNESGMGSAPIVAAAAQTRNPVRQALISSSGTFWDTLVICAITGLVIVSSVLAYPDITWNNGSTLTKVAFDKIPYVGEPLLAFGMITFAFSTILGWSYYGERSMEYLGGRRFIIVYRIIYVLMLIAGATMNLAFVWNVADLFNALMAIPNLLSLLLLSTILYKETHKYLWCDRLDRHNV